MGNRYGLRSSKPVLACFTIAVMVTGCEVQWVSPYSADLQKKATDMLSDVITWEGQMRSAAGTAAADPRHPDIQAKLAAWSANIEAMGEIELSIDPGATVCDAFLDKISSGVDAALRSKLPSAPAVAGSGGGLSLSSTKSLGHCETLPHIFSLMRKQVDTSADTPPKPALLQTELEGACKLDWLPDDYFTVLKENRATAGASTTARPASAASNAGAAPDAAAQKRIATSCRALFEAPAGTTHGPAVTQLVTSLDAIIYREGRQAPTASSK